MPVLSKCWAWLGLVIAILGALNTAEILTLVGPPWATLITVLGTVMTAVSKALQDTDGDGVPDGFGGGK